MFAEGKDSQLSFIVSQVSLCMLPTLKQNLDEVQFSPGYFHLYHTMLKQELPVLYDLLQKNEEPILIDDKNQELRGQLLLLLFELTATPTIYSLGAESAYLLQNANQLLGKLSYAFHKAEESYIFSYYEKHLHKDSWKRQLGAIHGFVRYLEYRLINNIKMPTSLLTFSIAIGLNVRECYQAEYKQLGVRIFSHMLKHGSHGDVQELNIQSVIYEHVFRDAHSLDSVESTASKWYCLCLCLDHFAELNAFTWNQCDDMLERLISNVSLASTAEMSLCLLHYITKLGYYFTLNKDEIKTAIESDFTDPNQLTSCLQLCASLNVSTSYRWAKSILEMLVLQSEKLLHNPNTCVQILVSMQRCYMICILPIPLQTLHVHLREFYGKFVAVLLESLLVHKKDRKIQLLTHAFLQIFSYQLKTCPPNHQVNEIMKDYTIALEKLQPVIANKISV